MRIAFAFLLAVTAGCSAGSPPSTEGTGATGGSSPATGGTGGTTGKGGSSGVGTGGSNTGGTGATTGGSNTGGSGATGGAMPPPPPSGVGIGVIGQCMDPNAVGPTPLRRISRLEYHNAVRDLFGVEMNQGDLPSDELLGVFTANVRTRMTADQFTRYDTAGKSVAESVAPMLANLAGCGATDAACFQTYLTGKARQAFHGVLEDADRQKLVELHTAVAADDLALANATAIRWILASPRFLYPIEFGTPSGNVSRLSASEVAGRLATFLWRSVPDAELLQAADSGALASPEGLRQQATRMVADTRAEPVLRQFVTEWLGLADTPGTAPLDNAVDAEPGDVFVAAAQGAGTYPELLTSLQTRGPQELASFYGGTANGDGTITVPPERQGLLLRASFLRSHVKGDVGSPTQRGKQIRDALLCDPVALPEDNVNMTLPPPQPGQDTNDVFELHGSEPACAGCHAVMDPIGFAFGQYGPDGAYDAALSDSTAGVINPGEANPLDVEFQSVTELIDVLANDENPQQCFVLQMNRFALGRAETTADGCALTDIWSAFEAGNKDLRTLLVEVAVSPMMQMRNVVRAGEMCQ